MYSRHPKLSAFPTILILLLFAISGSSKSRLSAEENRDLSWVPEDFAEKVAGLAWEHQFDIDGTVFRRNLNRYLSEISRTVV